RPLDPGTELKGGVRIIELLTRSSDENRYRAERTNDGVPERLQLRERQGPQPPAIDQAPASDANGAVATDAARDKEDPSGPHAKTADLKLRAIPPAQQQDVKPDSASASAAAIETDNETSATAESESALVLTEAVAEAEEPQHEASAANGLSGADGSAAGTQPEAEPTTDDLGEVFGRVMGLSLTLNHPAFQRALDGFADRGRVYLVYPDEELNPLARSLGGLRMGESEAMGVAIQVCQAVGFVHRRGLRVNDICPESVAVGAEGRIKLTGLEYISNDNELQAEPIFNDGYSAPEIYRAKKVDKRADVFSIGALLYTCLTGERLDSETWRGEAGPIRFYPPHVVTPALEQVVRRALLFSPEARWASVDALKAKLVELSSMVQIRAAVLSDVGIVRELNEDAVMTLEYRRDSQIEPAQNFLYVVADGMGGAEAGEVASAIAVAAIRNYVEEGVKAAAVSDGRMMLQDALEEANRKILEYVVDHPEARGMGSTAVGTFIQPPEAAVAWVGDSRVYLCNGGILRQLTKDHSLVQRLVEIGQITPEEARHHEHKNVITRSLGARQSGAAGAESIAIRLKRGDRIMLCSDGLTAHVEDERIGEILRRHSDPNDAARELVVAANAGGGTDNVSVVVIFAG
ncbi:MAG TPA: Stp1/IreP family PP2C-type Ser/Thr phosphatase, partial [Paraburkholderia sp.]|nr:Stp1/IreP family PP2C-type Ser/Thr phosphatase [Paraburkholderia sp.]